MLDSGKKFKEENHAEELKQPSECVTDHYWALQD